MKKTLIALCAAAISVCAFAFQKALYIKVGNTYYKINMGVAEQLTFTDNGKNLQIQGYDMVIPVDEIQKVTLAPQFDEMAMGSEKQKERINEIGNEALGMIDANDNAELIKMVDTYLDDYDFGDIPAYEDLYHNTFWEREYDLAGDELVPRPGTEIMASMKALAQGNPTAGQALAAAATEIWKARDFYGIFEPVKRYEWSLHYEWIKKADADYAEYQCPSADGGTYTARVQASESYTDWTESDFTCRVPSKVEVTMKKNDTLLASATITMQVDNSEKTLAMTTTAEANGYVVEDHLTVNDTEVVNNTKVTVKGKAFATGNTHINGRDLTNYNVWKEEQENATDGHYNGRYWEDGNSANLAMAHFINATSDIDILGKLQVKARVAKIGHVYDTLTKDYDYTQPDPIPDHSKAELNYYENDEKIAATHAIVDCLNNYTDVTFYYDGTDQIQGYINYEYYDNIWEYGIARVHTYVFDEDSQSYVGKVLNGYSIWNAATEKYDIIELPGEYNERHHYTEIHGLLTFPDQTTYILGDDSYFNKANFGSLVTSYEKIIDTVELILDKDDEYDEYEPTEVIPQYRLQQVK